MKAGKAVLSAGACALVLALTPVLAFGAAPNDPLYPQQWALDGSASSILAPQAWCASMGNVLVADVDTGADFNHADLAGKLIPGAAFLGGRGAQTGSGQAAVQDNNGHGTMTTGIMVAGTNNGAGIAAVAPAAKALVVKVLDANGSGYGADVAAGIDYASSYPGVRVINLSIGSDTPGVVLNLLGGPNPILPAINRAIARGVMVAAAAGNTAGATGDYASVENEALVVGALNRAGTIASYSTAGNIYAPGGDSGGTMTPAVSIVSTTVGNAYAAGDGTSFAAPQVAGAVALLMGKGFSAAAARQQILNTANQSVNQGQWPVADAASAMGLADGGPACAPGTASGGSGSPPPVHQTSPKPRPPAAPAQAPAAVPAASPSPSPSPSPSQEVALLPPGAAPSDSGTLAARTRDPSFPTYGLLWFSFRSDQSLLLLAVAVVAGGAAGYGAVFLVRVAIRQ